METRKNFINIAHPHFSINKQCQILEVGKSSYYYQQKPRIISSDLLNDIREIWSKHPYKIKIRS